MSFSKSVAQKQIKKLILSNFMSTTLFKDTELLRERFKDQNESYFFMPPVTCCNQLRRDPDAHSPCPLNLNTQDIAATLAMSF